MKILGVRIEKTELAKELEKELDINWDLYQPHPYDAGFDVRACIKDSIKLNCNDIIVIPTGLHIQMHKYNYEIQVRPRSGLAAKYGITVVNTPGTVDFGYRDEVKVILTRLGTDVLPFIINPGDRIAQICFREIPVVHTSTVNKIDREIDRKGGFGSSGHE